MSLSLNDPQWGKRGGGGGPPDLDEMWRNFNQKLNGMFGRRRGGGGGGGAPGQLPSFRQLGGGIGLLVGLILLVWLASGFYIVVEGQRGVVLTFGKFSEVTNAGPALAASLPDPDARDRRPHRRAHGRGRLPQQRQDQGAARIADADRRREHHRHPVRGAVHPQGSDGLPVQQPAARGHGAAGGGNGVPRNRRQEQDGLRALRGPRAGRGGGAEADAGDPRPLQDRHRHQQGDHAERAAAGAGAGGLRRRGAGQSRTWSGRRTRARPTPTTSCPRRAAPRRA